MNDTICIDANIVVQFVAFPEEQHIQRLWEQWKHDRTVIIAPAILFYEVTNALYKYLINQIYTRDMIFAALRAAVKLPITLIEDAELHLQAAAKAEQFGLRAAYDAHYLVLAERYSADLWTTDQRLARRARELGIQWVKLLEEENE